MARTVRTHAPDAVGVIYINEENEVVFNTIGPDEVRPQFNARYSTVFISQGIGRLARIDDDGGFSAVD